MQPCCPGSILNVEVVGEAEAESEGKGHGSLPGIGRQQIEMECAVIEAGAEGQVYRVALYGASGSGGVALDETPAGEPRRFRLSGCGAEGYATIVERCRA